VRLLLDEMYPPSIAQGLRDRGHDAVAVVERPELRQLADDAVFAAAQRERRAVVTENVADFARIADDHDRRGAAHHGLVLVPPGRYPRGRPRTVGAMVGPLDKLARQQDSDEPTSRRVWL
jgi:Domain of unknown function (DUF5615)